MKTNFKKNIQAENDFFKSDLPTMKKKATSLDRLPTVSLKKYPCINNLARFGTFEMFGMGEVVMGEINPTLNNFKRGFNTMSTVTYSEQIFRVFVFVHTDGKAYLINTEGYDYCRYIAEVVWKD